MLEQHFGCVRFAYNHFLRQRIDYYAENKGSQKKGLNYHDTARALTQMKKNPEFEWLKAVNSQSLQQSLQRLVSRKAKSSSNRRKAVLRLARQHEKVSNQRQDFLHKASRQLVRENQAIFIESLAIRNMIRNHHLARSISDSGWYMFVNMLKYKGQWYGCSIHEIDRFFPSSKCCHRCGYIHNSLELSDRSWVCPECNEEHDRDVNAAINILAFGRAGTVRIDACGEEVQQGPSVKQEAPTFMRG